MPNIKDLLMKPTGALSSVEATLPRGLPRLSQSLARATFSLPSLNLPSLPKIGSSAALPMPPDIFKSITVGLPKPGGGQPPQPASPAPATAAKVTFGYE